MLKNWGLARGIIECHRSLQHSDPIKVRNLIKTNRIQNVIKWCEQHKRCGRNFVRVVYLKQDIHHLNINSFCVDLSDTDSKKISILYRN